MKYETILRAIDKHNSDFNKRVGKDHAKGTATRYSVARNHVANFISSYYHR